ncbi:MAG: hypothetical protein ACTSVC_13105, partial [Promethearchaeota archaeon]
MKGIATLKFCLRKKRYSIISVITIVMVISLSLNVIIYSMIISNRAVRQDHIRFNKDISSLGSSSDDDNAININTQLEFNA